MIRVYTKFLILLMVPFLFAACEQEDEFVRNEPPKIAFSVAAEALQDINLDMGTGPAITGTVQSDAGLERVVVELLKKGGVETLMEVTTFGEPSSTQSERLFFIDILPAYTEEVIGFRVIAEDVEGRVAEKVLAITADGGFAGPVLELPETVKANVRPTANIRPAIEGTASSHWGLESLAYFLVNETEEVADGETTFADSVVTSYDLNVVPDYDRAYEMGATGYKVVAIDGRGNVSVDTVALEVIDAAPAPTITFDQESVEADMTVDPAVTPEVSGVVTGENLAKVTFYLVSGDTEEQFGETVTSFADPNSYTFNVEPPYKFGVTGIRVKAEDVTGQVSSETIEAQVTAEDTELNTFRDIVSYAQGMRNDGVNTNFSSRDGNAYTLQEGTDPAISETIDFITADSGGDNELDLFSPSHPDWLAGNYFEDADDQPVVWPVLNETKMVLIEGADEAFFNNATSVDIKEMTIGSEFETRMKLQPDKIGSVVFFETAQGKKGLLFYKASDLAAGKSDKFTFDVKVVE
ncbi:hypothetical protein [Nafulsella turpanensis]|uniref:hypothetical protein n=1 Tax=Nafulsella turpanensis TaxID=1265690 RepID=UPI00037A6402|nr:hypothetical protein [Nafulsella turpanensis]